MLFKDFVNEYILYIKPKLKESTYYLYLNIINTKLLKYDFNIYRNKLINSSLSNKYIRDILTLLKSILKFIELKYDANFKLNLFSFPKIYNKDIKIFNNEERNILINYCLNSNNINTLGILIGMYPGLRIGEICALKWSDIDFKNKCIYVNNTVQRIYKGNNNTKVIIDRPKTTTSKRIVPICNILINKLKVFYK